jgi:hypothetical protein
MKFLLVFSVLIPFSSFTPVGTRVIMSQTMSFDQCLEFIRTTASNLAMTPTNIVETNDLRMVRISTNDGSGKSYLISCSRLDQKLVVNESW